jgi:hypothetical protein
VIALPAVEAPQMPPLHPVDPKEVYCAEKTELVLPAEGAPLAFATGYAHDMVLRLKGKNGKLVDLPVKADAEKGGFIANTAGLSPSNFGDVLGRIAAWILGIRSVQRPGVSSGKCSSTALATGRRRSAGFDRGAG